MVNAGLGARWHMLDTAFKPYPCAHSIHAFVEAILSLNVTAAEVEHVLLHVPAGFAGQIAEPRAAKLTPRTTTHARASLPYTVAAALCDGAVGMQHYTDQAIHRPDLLDMAQRIDHRLVPDASPIRFSGAATLVTKDGRTLYHAVDDAAGTGPKALGRAQVEAKARTICPGAGMDHVIAMVDQLHRLDRIDGLLPG